MAGYVSRGASVPLSRKEWVHLEALLTAGPDDEIHAGGVVMFRRLFATLRSLTERLEALQEHVSRCASNMGYGARRDREMQDALLRGPSMEEYYERVAADDRLWRLGEEVEAELKRWMEYAEARGLGEAERTRSHELLVRVGREKER